MSVRNKTIPSELLPLEIDYFVDLLEGEFPDVPREDIKRVIELVPGYLDEAAATISNMCVSIPIIGRGFYSPSLVEKHKERFPDDKIEWMNRRKDAELDRLEKRFKERDIQFVVDFEKTGHELLSPNIERYGLGKNRNAAIPESVKCFQDLIDYQNEKFWKEDIVYGER